MVLHKKNKLFSFAYLEKIKQSKYVKIIAVMIRILFERVEM